MRLKERDPRIAARKGHYHSMTHYLRLKRQFEANHQPVKNGKFHRLAKKLESALPRGLRTAGGLLTTELLLKVINDEKLQEATLKRKRKEEALQL
ncbi:hypothetical protein [Vibrio parahaemolyticus]|uniref:hypothetical protein n=1 Tax=Vibrio parahaemolyticus TaxID=670 RepID=UPI0008130B54|nr:hypothetical protein [Vibrio parahaemolyticus]OCP68257.1 hypothetical protein AKH08_15685 [Vibrio parahaemolyticus]